MITSTIPNNLLQKIIKGYNYTFIPPEYIPIDSHPLYEVEIPYNLAPSFNKCLQPFLASRSVEDFSIVVNSPPLLNDFTTDCLTGFVIDYFVNEIHYVRFKVNLSSLSHNIIPFRYVADDYLSDEQFVGQFMEFVTRWVSPTAKLDILG